MPSAIAVGTQFDWSEKKARFSISIAPLKTRPALKAASADATTGVWLGANFPYWKSSRTIGSASTALITAAGTSRNAIWRSPRLTVFRKPS